MSIEALLLRGWEELTWCYQPLKHIQSHYDIFYMHTHKAHCHHTHIQKQTLHTGLRMLLIKVGISAFITRWLSCMCGYTLVKDKNKTCMQQPFIDGQCLERQNMWEKWVHMCLCVCVAELKWFLRKRGSEDGKWGLNRAEIQREKTPRECVWKHGTPTNTCVNVT